MGELALELHSGSDRVFMGYIMDCGSRGFRATAGQEEHLGEFVRSEAADVEMFATHDEALEWLKDGARRRGFEI